MSNSLLLAFSIAGGSDDTESDAQAADFCKAQAPVNAWLPGYDCRKAKYYLRTEGEKNSRHYEVWGQHDRPEIVRRLEELRLAKLAEKKSSLILPEPKQLITSIPPASYKPSMGGE
jgi:hypothetical protein